MNKCNNLKKKYSFKKKSLQNKNTEKAIYSYHTSQITSENYFSIIQILLHTSKVYFKVTE